jgi:inner membrane protein involved in colicin E2 resistance
VLRRFVSVAAIGGIFLFTSIAWLILGGTISQRTHNAGSRLSSRVQSIWGAAQTQRAPLAEYEVDTMEEKTIHEKGQTRVIREVVQRTRTIQAQSSRVRTAFDLQHRQKGLLWYATYKVDYQGDYEFTNPHTSARMVRFVLPLPGTQAIYDDLQLTADSQPVSPVTAQGQVSASVQVGPGQTVKFGARYRSQGLGSWQYSFGENVNQIRNFQLAMRTNFRDVDFPDNTLAPSAKRENPDGWDLEWRYNNLVSGYHIALTMPEKLQPGPLAAEISYFAPVSLLFFFFVMFIITTLRGIDLHPVNYFFLAGAFFAFHLLFAYLVDHLDIHVSFAISSVVSVFLVASYLRLVVGNQFAFREAAAAQMVYLVLFSYAFFLRGLTGLAITIGAILTLFVTMQLTGRIKWEEKFGGAYAGEPPPLPTARNPA